MNKAIAKELEILWSDFDRNDLDTKLKAFERRQSAASREDLPQF